MSLSFLGPLEKVTFLWDTVYILFMFMKCVLPTLFDIYCGLNQVEAKFYDKLVILVVVSSGKSEQYSILIKYFECFQMFLVL